jgi:hypothetical protein
VFRVDGRRIRAVTESPLKSGTYKLTLPKDSLWIF